MQEPTITIQAEKGSELSWLEADANFLTLRNLTKNWVRSHSQTVHGLFVGELVRNVAGTWTRAQATSYEAASATAVVVGVPDANTLVLLHSGAWETDTSMFTPGQTLYVSETLGAITAVRPESFQKVVGHVLADGLIYVTVGQTPVITNFNKEIGGLVGQFAFNPQATSPGNFAVILWQRGNSFTVFKNETGSYNLGWTQPLDDAEYSLGVTKDRPGSNSGGWSIQGEQTTTSVGLLFEKDNETLDGHVNYDPTKAIISIFGRKSV
jgi:hypothetical protein